ncbi:unnamed protein product [Paramecium octaurelia]|uniref:Uncharacterized protein n=1 Tax=Paramecium octaurelia TaxID=43137 RepID=A0A8S1VJ32_PAROT|nr:unnamed protein product [Paramecium octaurelia]
MLKRIKGILIPPRIKQILIRLIQSKIKNSLMILIRLNILPNQSGFDFYLIIRTCFYNLLLIIVEKELLIIKSHLFSFLNNQVSILENYSKTQTKIQITITIFDPFRVHQRCHP